MLVRRVLTAVIGIPMVYLLVYYGQNFFFAGILLLALVGFYEFASMLRAIDVRVAKLIGFIGLALIISIAQFGNMSEMFFSFLIITIVTLLRIVFNNNRFSPESAAFTILGCFYIGGLFSTLILLRNLNPGLTYQTIFGDFQAGFIYTWLAFIGTWAHDTFAFFAGSMLGKHKLCPAISPGKTVEGFIGGVLGSIILTTPFAMLLSLTLVQTVLLGMAIGLSAAAGDLTESAIKRFAGVKDSGQLFPGHGGILDRFDSILFVAPTVYYFLALV